MAVSKPEILKSSSPIQMLDLINVDLAVGISISSKSWPITSSISEVAYLGFPLPASYCISPTSAIDMPDPNNVKVATEIVYLASIEAKIHWFMSRILWNITLSGFAAAILDHWKVMNYSRSCHFVAQSYSGSHQGTPLNFKRLQNGIENTGLGGVNYPHGPYYGLMATFLYWKTCPYSLPLSRRIPPPLQPETCSLRPVRVEKHITRRHSRRNLRAPPPSYFGICGDENILPGRNI